MTLQRHLWLAFALLLAAVPACDDTGSTKADNDSLVQHDTPDTPDTPDSPGSPDSVDSTTTSDLTQSDTTHPLDVDTTDLNDDSTLPNLSDPFLYGINLGHPNAAWGDGETASLAAAAGCNSLRPKLPEYHLQRWGYEIEVGDMQRYASDGLHQNIAFVIGASREHSTIPAAEPDWKLDYYIPANLYEPIWLSEGVVNPDNYWAAYLFQTMTIYKDWVQYWEIWNEPDWVSDWRISQEWATRAPTAADLPRFNGSIFDYVRMLRIAWEVKQVAAPETWIAVGGLGYPNFLDALVRYTDNPAEGAVSDVFSQTGAAYFEVLSFHHYPHLSSTGNSDAAAQGVLDHKADFQTVLDRHGVGAKRWIITESGAAGTLIAGTPSGPEYARNYLWKAMALAQADGIDGIHWFVLSQSLAAPNNAFDHMGLYQDLAAVSTPADAVISDTGIAYRTLGSLLHGARVDLDVTPTLNNASGVRGVAFVLADGRRAWMLWAEGSDEAASATTTLTAAGSALMGYQWDGTSRTVGLADGQTSIELSSGPTLLVSEL